MADFIKVEEAIEIVLGLARQQVNNDYDDNPEKGKTHWDACDTIEDFFVNVVFKDE